MSRLRRDDGATDAKWFGGGGDIFGPVMLALRLGCSLAEEPPHCAYESIVEENRMWRYWVVRIGLWYDWLPGQGSWEMVAEFTKGYTEPMHNLSLSISVRGTQRLSLGIRTDNSIYGNRVAEIHSGKKIEDGAHSNGSEKAGRKSLPFVLDLWKCLLQGEDERNASEQEDQDSQENQAVDWDDFIVCEGIPRSYGTVPHEDGEVEKHIDGWLQ
ncbi:MAG: hypothetical protein L6R37_002878 [Teloschistes peruensis]|nr:MAG: hypothetical protein L6R37_002878 [Teloschistes peruensis]